MASQDPNRPNFLVVMTDDQGPWALGCCGNDELRTPVIDSLAERGTRFDNFFCASPVCSPARASMITGRMPSAHGVHDWVRGEAYGILDEDTYLDGITTTPEVLAEHGWRCGHSGKWHLGSSKAAAPGFDFWYAHRTGDGPYRGASIWRDGRREAEPRYFTHAVTEESQAFLEHAARDDSPFYLQVNYTAPHSPWVGQNPVKYEQLYDDCAFASCPREEPHPWFSWEPGPVSDAMRDPIPSLLGYFASLSAVDEGVAELLGTLDQHGLSDSTCVVFTSDNGYSCGHHGIWGKGNATWPLNMWENSVRVPAIVTMPGRVGAGHVDHGLASACDLHPTLLDLAGVPVPADPLAAGRSLVPRLSGPGGEGHESVMVFDEYGARRMVRTADWKLVISGDDFPDELYDLRGDPGEVENKAALASCATIRDELTSVLVDWFAERSDPALDAFHRPVSGRGQTSPLWRGRPDAETYHSGDAERRAGPVGKE